jgi:hypothetical protein
MDVGHTVNHLSFGPFLSETAWAVMPPDVAQSVGSLDDKAFTSEVRFFVLIECDLVNTHVLTNRLAAAHPNNP